MTDNIRIEDRRAIVRDPGAITPEEQSILDDMEAEIEQAIARARQRLSAIGSVHEPLDPVE